MINLPLGWATATLAQIATVTAGQSPPSNTYNREGDGIPFFQGKAEFKGDTAIVRKWTSAPSRLAKAGDILLSVRAPVGPTVLAPTDCAIGRGLAAVRAHDYLDQRYLFWAMRAAMPQLVAAATGSTFEAVTARQVAMLTIPVAPVIEQRSIIAVLERNLSRLDLGRETVAGIGSKMNSLRALLLDRVISGRTVADPEMFDMEGAIRELVGAKPKRIKYDSLPGLPPGWHWHAASDVCEAVFSGGTPDAALMYSGTGDVPFLKVYNISKTSVLDFSIRPTFIDRSTHERQLRRSRVRPGDVLTNIVGPPLGKTAVVPSDYDEWNINQAIVGFRAGPSLSPDWLALALRSKFVLRRLEATAKATAGQFNIALSACRELPIPMPPRDVQEELTQKIDRLAGKMLLTVEQATQAESRISHLTNALLAAAFTGKLAPQDPRNESASILLERINADREWAPGSGRGRRRTLPIQTEIGMDL